MRMTNLNRLWRRQALFLALLTALTCGDASAQYIVKDPFGLMAKMEQISKDAAEFGKNAERWKTTSDHYQQQVIKLRRLNFGQAAMEDSFALRDLDYGMDDTCPGPAQGIQDQLASTFRQALPKMDGNVVSEQMALCRRLVYAENRKYNDSVTMLKTLLRRSKEFALIEEQRDSVSNSQGALAANDNEASRFVARNQLDLDYWQARMKAYDDYIAALKADHLRLAKRAMRGKRGALDGIVPTDVIKTALAP